MPTDTGQEKSKEDTSVFEKLPLDQTKKEIRVLQLPDGKDIIHCRLHKVSLDAWTPEFKSFDAGYANDHKSLSNTEHLAAKATEQWVLSRTEDCRQGHTDCGPLVIPHSRLHPEALNKENFREELDPSLMLQAPASRDSRSTRQTYAKDEIDQLKGQPDETLPDMLCCAPRFVWGDFEALSYCWGSDERVCDLVVNDTLVKVPKSLNAALYEIRKLPEIRAGMHIWCDALCISQNDNQEKNHQVSLMSQIFRKAFSIIAWLGPSSPTMNKVIDNLTERHWIESWDWSKLYVLFTRPYWSRLWIIQELILNENLTVFLVGDRLIPRTLLYRFINQGIEYAAEIAETISRAKRYEKPPDNREISQVQVFTTLRRIEFLCGTSECGYLLQQDLARVLEASQNSECKEPVDRIYGLLGLLPPDLRCFPDYTIPVAEAYEQFADLLYMSKGLTGLLCWCDYSPVRKSASWIPDWTRLFPRNHLQWLVKRTASGLITEPLSATISDGKRIYCTAMIMESIEDLSSSSIQRLPFATDHPEGVHGWTTIRVDPVQNRYGGRAEVAMALERTLIMEHPGTCAAKPLHEEHKSRASTTIIGNIYWINWYYLERTILFPHCESDYSRSFWGTMLAVRHDSHFEDFDRFRQSNAKFSVFGIPFHSFFPGMKMHWDYLVVPKAVHDPHFSSPFSRVGDLTSPPPQRVDQLTDDDLQNMRLTSLAVKGRRLITTMSGYLGLVPDEARKGDQVVVLRGCNFPVILRAASTGDQAVQAYEYIGECYIDGLMNGECMSEDANKQQPKQICLV